MSAMLAKRMGAKKVMVLIQRGAYVDLVQGGVIDVAISPQQATISALLTHVRRADIVNVSSLRRGAAEAIEAVAHGDETTSKVVGRAIGDIKLPPGTTIGAIVRGEEVLIAHDRTVIEQDDHVVMFLVDKKYVPDVEALFPAESILPLGFSYGQLTSRTVCYRAGFIQTSPFYVRADFGRVFHWYGRVPRLRPYRSDHSSRRFYLFNDWSNRQIQTQRA